MKDKNDKDSIQRCDNMSDEFLTARAKPVRVVLQFMFRLLLVLLRYHFRQNILLQKRWWLQLLGRNQQAGLVKEADRVLLYQNILNLTTELHAKIGNSMVQALLERVIYKGEYLKVLDEGHRQGGDLHKPKTYKQRSLPDKRHETLVRIGKTSPGLSPP